MESVSELLLEALVGLGTEARTAGLFLAGILDSTFVSLPEINDALLFYMSTLTPRNAPYFVLAATLGSVGGCLLLNRLAHWKGTEYVGRFLPGARFPMGQRLYQRYGAWTLFVPCLLPPPCPFKVFIVFSGLFGLPLPRFLAAVAVGRGLRYSLGAILAIRYGRQALELIEPYYPHVLAGVAGASAIVVAIAAARFARERVREPRRRVSPGVSTLS